MQQPDRQARLQALLQRGERVVNAAHEPPGLLEDWTPSREIEVFDTVEEARAYQREVLERLNAHRVSLGLEPIERHPAG